MTPEVWTTRKPAKYARRSKMTSRKVCADLDHARNLSRFNIREDPDVIRIVVWVDETTRYVWIHGEGWTGPEQSQQRVNYFARRPIR